MTMNRRNVLIGLGTIVAGGGAALGTGAFSSVEANRTVSVDTAGDEDAFLGISVDSDYAADGAEEDAVEISLEGSDHTDGFNDNAITNVEGVLTLTNNAADDEDIEVSFGDREGDDHSESATVEFNDVGEVTFTLAETNGGDYYELSDGDSVDVNVEVDTTTDPGEDNQELTIYAFDTNTE
ncbi:hypothetical protein [Natrialbaceae archaeon AArc-T1-2]|uniref:hypothetical protein n=1 Tax=Natrialbaceae archaeon AArc-T1-2 TaxID=3053904 RepID=UPI00255AE33A|nr:hypothetical protein [Natrialbaceae archaeon AArc-T1-2]WIV65761.1 hypothetical protein QQ977_08580 [Natrialbaceae archaeon AArc-T1-2]